MSEALDGGGREWVEHVLETSSSWPHGPVELQKATRIGVEHGLSGRVSRIVAETATGASVSFVLKEERAEAVDRELLFHRENGDALRGSVPTCYGGGNG